MSEKNRVAYILLREEELSVQEAADVLGTTTAVVKQRAHRAYEQLRAAVGAAGWHPRERARGARFQLRSATLSDQREAMSLPPL